MHLKYHQKGFFKIYSMEYFLDVLNLREQISRVGTSDY